jgi:hypothetical protein
MYYFEYDKSGFLFKYKESYENDVDLLIEKENNFYNEENILCYYFLTGSTIYRIENNGVDRNVVKYDTPVMFKHRFEAGESWMSVIERQKNINFQYQKKEEKEDEESVKRGYPSFYYKSKKETQIKKEILIDNNYHFPNIKKQLFLQNNKLYNFRIQIEQNNLSKWKSLIDFIN